MSSTLMIPLKSVPSSIAEVQAIVTAAFRELDLAAPMIRRNEPSSHVESLLDEFVFVEGNALDRQCWLSFFEYSDESQRTGFDVTLSVETRGSWTFAAIVAYAFCKHAGYIVFNDSSELNGQHTYTADELRSVLLACKFES